MPFEPGSRTAAPLLVIASELPHPAIDLEPILELGKSARSLARDFREATSRTLMHAENNLNVYWPAPPAGMHFQWPTLDALHGVRTVSCY